MTVGEAKRRGLDPESTLEVHFMPNPPKEELNPMSTERVREAQL